MNISNLDFSSMNISNLKFSNSDISNVNIIFLIGKSLLFEPVFVKAGINSLRSVYQQSALEACRIELDAEVKSLFYPFDPCHYGYLFGGVDGPGSKGYLLAIVLGVQQDYSY